MRYISGWVVSFTADQYAVYKWLGCKFYPRYFWRGYSSITTDRENTMKKTGFYIIKDQFFVDMADPYLKGNKGQNRPHYYCFKDAKDGIYWVIPLSSKVEKYRKIIESRIAAGKPCDTLHIAKLDDHRESAFLIQDMFPITDEYIERKYTIAGNHLMLTSEHLAEEIEKKARRVAGLLRRGIKFMPTQPDVNAILKILQEKRKK